MLSILNVFCYSSTIITFYVGLPIGREILIYAYAECQQKTGSEYYIRAVKIPFIEDTYSQPRVNSFGIYSFLTLLYDRYEGNAKAEGSDIKTRHNKLKIFIFLGVVRSIKNVK